MQTDKHPPFPSLLQEVAELILDTEVDFDYEPYESFMNPSDTRQWFQAWTGNKQVDGHEFLCFGQDGSGGYVAIWLAREDAELLEQPVVFFGSEGELKVLACSVYDYLWLLANGLGPYEAVAYPAEVGVNEDFTEFAEEHAPNHRKSALAVLAEAEAEFPTFVEDVRQLCESEDF